MLNNHLLSCTGNIIKLSNSLGVTWWLSDFVTGLNPAYAGLRHKNTIPMHRDTKDKQSKDLNLTVLPFPYGKFLKSRLNEQNK